MAWQLIHYGTKFALLFYTLFHFILYLFIHIFFKFACSMSTIQAGFQNLPSPVPLPVHRDLKIY